MLRVEIHHRYAPDTAFGSAPQGGRAFDLEISFEAKGPVVALCGPSGAGKTSVVNAISGLLRPASARVTLGNETFVDTAAGRFVPPHRRGIGSVFQDGALFPHLSVRQNLAFGTWFRTDAKGAMGSAEMARLLGIEHLLDQRPATLSGGEKQRVAIGRALMARPRLLLLDEPMAALDADRRQRILPVFERVRDEMKVPIVYVSHNLDEVARLANDIVWLEDGRVRAVETGMTHVEPDRPIAPRLH
ncbi:MAG: ATP-binding cassette domain-containing protein [Hyphomicrobium sp.]|nr:ATP-binding cassette domain-containing protein [Hyphomicrobium sp.]